jgi:hypothetical protein
MDESKSFRRAFLAGLLTLGVAISGHLATTGVDAPQACRIASARSAWQFEPQAQMAFVQVEPRCEAGLAERVARAVIGAVLNGFA